jgi:hypothetical protein
MAISYTYSAVFGGPLQIEGVGFNSILSPGETSSTDIKSQINWSDLFWDIDSNGTDLVSFSLSDIADAYAITDNYLAITLTTSKYTSLTSTPGFGGPTPDSIDLNTGFLTDQNGGESPTKLDEAVGYSTTVPTGEVFYAGAGINLIICDGNDAIVAPIGSIPYSEFTGSGGQNSLTIAGSGGVSPYSGDYGFDFIHLGNGGPSTLILQHDNFFNTTGNSITVYGGNGGSTVVDTDTSTADNLSFIDGGGTETFVGGLGSNYVVFNAADLTNAQTINGNGGNTTLQVNGAGTLGLENVVGLSQLRLGTGGGINVVTLNPINIPQVFPYTLTIVGGNSGNSVDASALNDWPLVYIAGSQNDAYLGGQGGNTIVVGSGAAQTLFGGSGNDTFQATAANLTNTDILNGGAGTNLLMMQSAGVINDDGVSGIEGIVLASGTQNSLILTDVNFTGVTTDQIVVIGGNGGNAVNGAGLSSAHSLAVTAGTGTDEIVGGAGNDQFTLTGGNTTLQGNGGDNGYFIDAASGLATILDFKHGADYLDFKNTGFDLGTDNGMPAGHLAASVFSANTNGTFATSGNRFAYNTSTGALNYNPTGSVTPADTVKIATLDMSNNMSLHPTITLTDLYFQP